MTIHPFTKHIGNKVRKIRMSKGITVRNLAAMCGMDYSNFSRFENGYQDIRILTLKNIADVLQVDIKDFV